MLWRYDFSEIKKAVFAIGIDRGIKIAKVYGLTSGLYVTGVLENGNMLNFSDTVIADKIYDMKNNGRG